MHGDGHGTRHVSSAAFGTKKNPRGVQGGTGGCGALLACMAAATYIHIHPPLLSLFISLACDAAPPSSMHGATRYHQNNQWPYRTKYRKAKKNCGLPLPFCPAPFPFPVALVAAFLPLVA